VKLSGQRIDTLLPHEIARRGVGRRSRTCNCFDNMTVLENVMCGRHRLMASGILSIAARLPVVPREEADALRAARALSAFVGLAGAEDLPPTALSFGHQRLSRLRARCARAALLLMDEPAPA